MECSVDLVTRNLEDSVTAEALQLFLSRMVVERGGEYRWSCEKLKGGLGRGSVRGDISRDTDFSRDIFSLADGLKVVSK